MQYYQAPRLQKSIIQSGREFKMASIIKLAKPIKSAFSPECLVYLAETLCGVFVGP